MGFNILTLITFIPVIGIIIIALVPKRVEKSAKYIALASSIIVLGLAIYLLVNFDSSIGTMNMRKNIQPWIPLPRLLLASSRILKVPSPELK